MSLSFLIAMSDGELGRSLARSLEERGHRTQRTPDVESAATALAQGPVDACLLGQNLPERLSLARALADRGKVIVLVGSQPRGNVEPELLEGLSSDLLDPETGPGSLDLLLQRVSHLRQVLSEREELRATHLVPLDDLLEGPAAVTRRLRSEVERIASTPRTTVLIQGEPGTRKDILARGIHGLSIRRRAPIRTLDGRGNRAAAFTDHLAELLATTAGGTLIVLEVAGLDLAQQRELALVLAEPPTDVRFIATASVDLEELAARGRFSEDLLYRLNVLTLQVPPLRERREDLAGLARRMVARHTPAGLPKASLTNASEEALNGHDWPGNLRELEATLVRAIHSARGEKIHPGHLGLSDLATDERLNGASAALELGDRSLKSLEEALIRRVLEDERGNRSRAARILGINRSTLYNKLRLYGIE